MEHRHGIRRSTEAKVRLFQRGLATETGIVKNISNDGLFVEVEDPSALTASCVEVAPLDSSAMHERGVPAAVIHRSSDGLGLMFVSEARELLRFLRDSGP